MVRPTGVWYVQLYIEDNKRSVLRRRSRDTNRNIKRSVYCRYAVAKLSIATGYAMQIYNCLGRELRQL